MFHSYVRTTGGVHQNDGTFKRWSGGFNQRASTSKCRTSCWRCCSVSQIIPWSFGWKRQVFRFSPKQKKNNDISLKPRGSKKQKYSIYVYTCIYIYIIMIYVYYMYIPISPICLYVFYRHADIHTHTRVKHVYTRYVQPARHVSVRSYWLEVYCGHL